MPEPNGRELLSEWRSVMEAVIGSAASAAGRAELPRDLLRASQRQLDLLQVIVDAERRLQGDLVGGLFAPLDAIFDLLAQTGSALRGQAEALEAAGKALQESAALMKRQAELFERIIATARQPSELVKSAARGPRRPGASAATSAAAPAPAPRPTAAKPRGSSGTAARRKPASASKAKGASAAKPKTSGKGRAKPEAR